MSFGAPDHLMRTAFWPMVLFVSTMALGQASLPIHVGQNKTFDNTLVGFNRDILVEGVVEKGLISIGGNIIVKGTVKGNISALNGSVYVHSTGVVGGNVLCVGGALEVDAGARLDGKRFNYFNPLRAKGAGWQNTLKAKTAIFFAETLMLFLLIILTFYIFPNQINEASFELTQDWVKTVVKGVVTLASFVVAMFLSFLLMVVAVGFPLFLLLFCGFMVVIVFGAVVIFYRLAQTLAAISQGVISLVNAILVVVIVLGFLLHLPLIGPALLLVFLILGSGVVIDTRFGTNKQWFTKKSRYWSAG